MIFDYAVDVVYFSGLEKRYYFFTIYEAKQFIIDLKKWRTTLDIKEMSEPIRIRKLWKNF